MRWMDTGTTAAITHLTSGPGEIVWSPDGRWLAFSMHVDETRFGSGPHTVVIDHQNGFASLYGHLLERPEVEPGQPVKQGEVIGLTGDPDLTCASRPHLHLEIRNDTYHYAYNPVIFIEADWDTLALYGPPGGFQQDLSDPRRWTLPTDQPPVDFWSPFLNDYAYPWPPDWLE